MDSTEPDRKRRHLMSPTGLKKPPFAPLSEDKKLDNAVLQFQNQKLLQKLEAQKVEIAAFEDKHNKLVEKQQSYDNTLAVVEESWEELVNELESCCVHAKDLTRVGEGDKDPFIEEDGPSSCIEDAFLGRLLEKGASDNSSASNPIDQVDLLEHREIVGKKKENILRNIATVNDDLWRIRDNMYAVVSKSLGQDETSRDLRIEVTNLRATVRDLFLRHRSLTGELQSCQDIDTKNKAELKRLRGELEETVAELEESNQKLTILKAEKDAGRGASFPVLNFGNQQATSEKARDKHKQDMETAFKDLVDVSSSRLLELKCLNEERIEILKQLSKLQNDIKDVKRICSSQAYLLVKDQLVKAKADVIQYQALYEKLQVDRENIGWREKDITVKNDLADVFRRSAAVADSKITHIRGLIDNVMSEKSLIETKLEAASKDPDRKDIIAEFKRLVSSFPEEMGNMQSQLGKYKETASNVHSLRAEVQSLSDILNRKVTELDKLSTQSADQLAEMQKLQAMVHDLRDTDCELKLILEMFRRESTESRNIIEARNSEYRAWAHVHSLKTSLDEHNLESRVKTAVEAEAKSQQRLAATEAEIAELRQKLETSKRERSRLSDILKSKHEETEAYLSEIETIGQAYDDMQAQNQQLLQQITERDDYNTKLVLEGVRARQAQDGSLMEKKKMERSIQEAKATIDFYEKKAARIEDQLKGCSDQAQKLASDKVQKAVSWENTQRRLLDVRKSSQQLRQSLEESQKKVEESRLGLGELQIQLENERFERKRVEEDIEAQRNKASRLRSHIEGSSAIQKLKQEVAEYKEILKCSICHNRRKEVVITKCYHLFCNPCIQSLTEARHRKCPVCAATFGANDVKPIYI